jgi:hypothetical protein
LVETSSQCTEDVAFYNGDLYNDSPGTPDARSSTRIDPVANTARKSPVSSARW